MLLPWTQLTVTVTYTPWLTAPSTQAKLAEIEMARLEHAKLLAKIQKKQEEKRVIKVSH